MRVTRKTTAAAASAAVLSLLLTGCGIGSAESFEPSVRSHEQVTVFTWWASGVEKRGLDKLAEVFEEQHPGIEFVNDGLMGGGGSSTSKDHLQSRLETQDPPDVFVAHAGAELHDYIRDEYIQDLTPLYEEFGLKEAFPQDLIERLSTDDGKIYSVPSNIHRANLLWVNPSVLERNGLETSGEYDDLDDFIADLETLKQAGIEAPLSVGTTWPQVHLLETTLLADLGPTAYSGLWSGSTAWSDLRVTTALGHYESLMSYTNPDRNDLEWDAASEMVIQGDSAFNIMGDWALAAYDTEGKTYGEDYEAVPAPGTAGTFDFLADSFTMSAHILDEDSAKAWLQTVSSKEGQVEFNKIKGSIPARTDIDASKFSEYQKTAITSFGEDTIVSSVTHGAAVPVAQLSVITDAVRAFNDGSTDIATFQAALAASADA
ncbi:ABC transporter substrate-binding protein [Myceligenerans indicum]|uniref:Probable sugar-binding periplasmic protein n=1 Tax=Myceligenerans indicum TaxID=2593663 RepID=A0ABS1LLZ2_9MICO|nr:ABC transporter substrate-binding protein [Myceligenerans indicum]MBL0887068.1 carbohydrate ABC transporter substrate-binding protein [Myceligenerans indicum]